MPRWRVLEGVLVPAGRVKEDLYELRFVEKGWAEGPPKKVLAQARRKLRGCVNLMLAPWEDRSWEQFKLEKGAAR